VCVLRGETRGTEDEAVVARDLAQSSLGGRVIDDERAHLGGAIPPGAYLRAGGEPGLARIERGAARQHPGVGGVHAADEQLPLGLGDRLHLSGKVVTHHGHAVQTRGGPLEVEPLRIHPLQSGGGHILLPRVFHVLDVARTEMHRSSVFIAV
jgi:hypothetical protein